MYVLKTARQLCYVCQRSSEVSIYHWVNTNSLKVEVRNA